LFEFHLAQLVLMGLAAAAHFRLPLPRLSIFWWWMKLQQFG
jgi:hypothetical protein